MEILKWWIFHKIQLMESLKIINFSLNFMDKIIKNLSWLFILAKSLLGGFSASYFHEFPKKLFFVFFLLLPPMDRIWLKVFFIEGVLGKREVEHESQLMPYWTLLVIGSLNAMWARWSCGDLHSQNVMWVWHVCLLIA